jgi:hypothetical protein
MDTPMITFRKVRVNDFAPVVRAVYAEESADFIDKYHHEAPNGLDACIAVTVANIGASRFFKVESTDGVLVGFFVTDKIDGKDVMPSFHVRKIFRSVEYLQEFWKLITDTFNNDFFTSVGVENYPALQHLLKNDFQVVNNLEFEGKQFLILKRFI